MTDRELLRAIKDASSSEAADAYWLAAKLIGGLQESTQDYLAWVSDPERYAQEEAEGRQLVIFEAAMRACLGEQIFDAINDEVEKREEEASLRWLRKRRLADVTAEQFREQIRQVVEDGSLDAADQVYELCRWRLEKDEDQIYARIRRDFPGYERATWDALLKKVDGREEARNEADDMVDRVEWGDAEEGHF